MKKHLFNSSKAHEMFTVSMACLITALIGFVVLAIFSKGSNPILKGGINGLLWVNMFLIGCVGVIGVSTSMLYEVENYKNSKEVSNKIEQLRNLNLACDIKCKPDDNFDIHQNDEGIVFFSHKNKPYIIGEFSCFSISEENAQRLLSGKREVSELYRAIQLCR